MTDTIIASCHCGGTKLELPRRPQSLTQCTCTYCTKSGGLWCYYEVDEVRVVSAVHDRVYSPSSPLHEHHFCAACGCTTPDRVGGRLYGISPDYSLEDTETRKKKKAGVNANNAALGVKWVGSYANADKTKTYCVYEGPSEAAVREAAAKNSIPVDAITEVPVDLLPH